MAPRELIIGVIAVTTQLLYSSVYPYAERTFQSLPPMRLETESVLSGIRTMSETIWPVNIAVADKSHNTRSVDDIGSATGSTEKQSKRQEQSKKAKNGPGKRDLSREEVVEQAVMHHMMPHMSSITQTLQNNGEVGVSLNSELRISWNVHRITDAPVPWAYVFRVDVKNMSPRPCLLQGIARFYVLRAPGDLVFPIHRITDGPAGFTLQAGESYKYSWIFFTKYATLEASGGLLLENRTHANSKVNERFLNTTLSPVQPAKAKGIQFDEAQSLMKAHNFMGVIDLRGATYI